MDLLFKLEIDDDDIPILLKQAENTKMKGQDQPITD